MKRYFGNNGTPGRHAQQSQTNPWNGHLKQTTKRVTNYWIEEPTWGVDFCCLAGQPRVSPAMPFWRKLWDLRCHQPWRNTSTKVLWKFPSKGTMFAKEMNHASSTSNHQFVMLVFIGVLQFNMVCHKGQWWRVNLDDAFNECSDNVPIWFVCTGG